MKSFLKTRNDRCGGFTLIELLLVMAIISVLASLALVVIGDAQYNAQRNATSARINQISTLLQEQMEDYAVRRPPIQDVAGFINPNSLTRIADARQLIRRIMLEVVSSEMPRGTINVPDAPGAIYPSSQFRQWANDNPEFFINEDPSQLIVAIEDATTFRAEQFLIPGADGLEDYPEGTEPNPQSPAAIIRTQSEYLYSLLQRTESQGILAIESLTERAIGDTDGDGFLEIIDSWGNPIGFVFEMYDQNGTQVIPMDPDGIGPIPPTVVVEADLDSGFEVSDDTMNEYATAHMGIPARNIRLRIYSTGNANLSGTANITTFGQQLLFFSGLDTIVSN